MVEDPDDSALDGLGLGHNRTYPKFTLGAVQGLTNVVAAAAGYYCSYAVLGDGRLLAWGTNAGDGQLGTMSPPAFETSASWGPNSNTPVPVVTKFDADGPRFRPPFEGSRNLKDAETGVRIEFLIQGQFPGDGKPKPVAFPDPVEAGEVIHNIRYLRLPPLVELKLASGMTNPGRLRDLADVQELIRALDLPLEFSAQLNPFVRGKFEELWSALAGSPQPEE